MVQPQPQPQPNPQENKNKKAPSYAIGFNIGPTRTRFSDCCNEPITQNRCPQCGNWFDEGQGRRELKIRGIDGRSQPTPSQPNTPILFKMLDEKKPEKDSMPKYFKQLQESGKQIRGWTASDS